MSSIRSLYFVGENGYDSFDSLVCGEFAYSKQSLVNYNWHGSLFSVANVYIEVEASAWF